MGDGGSRLKRDTCIRPTEILKFIREPLSIRPRPCFLKSALPVARHFLVRLLMLFRFPTWMFPSGWCKYARLALSSYFLYQICHYNHL